MFRKLKRYWYNFTHPIIGEVWELHRVTPNRSHDKRYAPYDITPQRLESLIVDYQQRGYSFVSIDEIGTRLQTMTTWCKAIRASKCIAITLDDGYRDNYEIAYPIFKKYNVPFCIYVATGYIDKCFEILDNRPPILTTIQLKEFAKEPLCTLGAHTVTHPRLYYKSIEEQEYEIVESIRMMKQITRTDITNFAIPFGAKNNMTMHLLKREGITLQVDAWGGSVRMGMNPLRIPRYIVEEERFRK